MRVETYSDAVFDVATLTEAKRIILTPEGAASTDQRWQMETPYLLSLIEQFIGLDEHSAVLDFGCGVGRMSKALIDRFGCRVFGVDTSPSMRAFAAAYVSDGHFVSCAPDVVPWLGDGLFDAALAVWALQHCLDPDRDLDLIHAALKPGGRLFVVNDRRRLVPTVGGWSNDGKDVVAMIKQKFTGGEPQPLDPSAVAPNVVAASYWAKARKG